MRLVGGERGDLVGLRLVEFFCRKLRKDWTEFTMESQREGGSEEESSDEGLMP